MIEGDKIANIAPSSDVKPSAADCQEIFFIRLDKRKVGPSGRLLIAMAAKRGRAALIHSRVGVAESALVGGACAEAGGAGEEAGAIGGAAGDGEFVLAGAVGCVPEFAFALARS